MSDEPTSGEPAAGGEPAKVDGLDLPALESYFAEHVPGFGGRLTAEVVAGGRSNLTYLLSDGRTRWVLRRPPLGGLTPSAHDMPREFRVVAALSGTDVPVARAVALGDPAVLGVPFTVVEYVDGLVIRALDELHALPEEQITRCAHGLVDVLARLHAIDPAEVGLAGFGRAEGYLARQVKRWHEQWQRVRTRELDDVDRLHERLVALCPAESGASIVHGDYRIDNTILDPADPGTVRAVVDWEMATLGDPLADLGLHLAYSHPAIALVLGGSAASSSPRLPGIDELTQRYAVASGRDLGDQRFYLGLGYFKIAIIAEGIYSRFRQGATVGTGFELAGQAVEPLIAAGLATLTSTASQETA
ncbi:phosphotransferase family protein [Frankia sp. CNm7]|uniref:Phosphotransferase family protein n=1 Tax=Frankia nepalensis TaxID=1836974 RepID=A0A937RIY8_9ACTN|nr:phosphotransferase family protein [Frankia nepalensis]MBL7498820.1 phosphotransferase family protein [Frankia nepalensis]MBL7508625.1 phosphotransferase family protein [Frankia nepalensis]MBL7517457.1 phosphotransferase family protein [Frankia nepalensis]MBL7629704.1 phosphotransferase family protein [Frankia nepalensis]